MRVVCTDIPNMFFVSSICLNARMANVHTVTYIAGKYIDPTRGNGILY